ncbi:MAG: NADH-quinone oxidoreductase subunit NuoE [Proteobacteria bacterium]|nr:NADH-quinone oxidoreductase subunit NuoE [Pseudomonadota bacterium]
MKDSKKIFSFSEENLHKAKEILKRYPKSNKRSAVMPLLHLAQEQNNNWISEEVISYVAKFLDMHEIHVYEIAHFYTMYNKKPVGKYLLQICRTTPCWLNGSREIEIACKKKLQIDIGQTTQDGKFSLVEVECLGACVSGPVMQVNNDYYENLDAKKTIALLEKLQNDT